MARTLVNSVDITPATTAQVGDVIHSMLTEAEFQAIRGTDWVLADGRTAAGTKYNSVTGNANIPDMRGEFLRGADNNRGVDSGRGLGSTQNQATAKNGLSASTSGTATSAGNHYHIQGNYHQGSAPYGTTNIGGSNTRGDTGTRSDNLRYRTNTTGAHSHTLSATTTLSGDAETRPRNVAVNIFIKIN